MLICPNCQHQEYQGALFCSECGAQFIQSQMTGPATNIYTSIPDAAPEMPMASFPSPPREYADARIALRIMEMDHLIYVGSGNEFSVGRATSGQPIVPDIDLSHFDAYEAGVSRLHANLTLQSKTITVQDLGSVNGTRVNGRKLDPYTPVSITNGDIITLGKMKIQVLMRE